MQIKKYIPQTTVQRIIFSIFIYVVGGFLYNVTTTTIGNTIQLIAALYFFKQVIYSRKVLDITNIPKFFYTFLFSWLVILCVRMFFYDDNNLADLNLQKALIDFFCGYRVFPVFMIFIPLIVTKANISMRYFVKISILLTIVFLFVYPFAFWKMTTFQFSLNSAAEEGGYQDFISHASLGIGTLCPAFILLFWKRYLSKKTWYLFLIATIANLLIVMFMARRGSVVLTLLNFILLWMLYTIHNNKISKIRMFLFAILIAFCAFAIFSSLSNSFFSLLIERGDSDTRSGVANAFLKDFTGIENWLYGRGLLGTYYDRIFGAQRYSIETGYMFILLRGGLLYLIPYVMLLSFSSIRGYYKSKNIFIKSIAIIQFVSIIELYPWGYPLFNFKFFIIWLGVYVCNSRYYLNMTDDDVQNKIFGTLKK